MSQPRQDPHPILPCRNRSGADLPKNRFVIIDADQGVDAYEIATTTTAMIQGITLEDIPNGYNGDLAKGGRAIIQLGGDVTVGAKLTAAAGGKAIATTTAANHIGAIALQVGALDDLIECDILDPASKVGA